MEAAPPPPPLPNKEKIPPKKKTTSVPVSQSISTFNRKKLNRVENSARGDAPDLSARPGYEIADDEDKTLYYDTEEDVLLKVKKLAEYVKNSQNMVAYTGAGISTSANIPDYRSPNGVWETLAKGEKPKREYKLEDVVPTEAHMALAKLTEIGKLKGTVTTNLDGLHLRSGITPQYLSELHGNAFKRICRTCKKYFYVLPEMDKNNPIYRSTWKAVCPICSDRLRSTGVGFGSNLPQDEYQKAKRFSEPCDLALVLGTSMRVAPACNLPEKSYKNKGHLVICNLQKTPYDKYAALVIHAETDKVMKLLFKELNLEIPSPPKSLHLDPVDAI
jgi:NAD-dependent SIR2 family protein deacetylase